MFRLDVDLDDLTLDGIDAVLSVLFDDFKGKFTTDWAVTGPIIERLGVELSYTPPAEDQSTRPTLRVRAGEEREEEPCWMAHYDNEYEHHAKPLVAVAKALIRSKTSDMGLPLPAETAVKYLKRRTTALLAVLEESNCHDVQQLEEDLNTYILTPKSGEVKTFQVVVHVVKQLSDLKIIKEHMNQDNTDGDIDLLIVRQVI